MKWKVAIGKQLVNKVATVLEGALVERLLDILKVKQPVPIPVVCVFVHDPGPAQLDGTTWQKSIARKPFWTGINGHPARHLTRNWPSSRMATAGWQLHPDTTATSLGFIPSVCHICPAGLTLSVTRRRTGPCLQFPTGTHSEVLGPWPGTASLAGRHTHDVSPSFIRHWLVELNSHRLLMWNLMFSYEFRSK